VGSPAPASRRFGDRARSEWTRANPLALLGTASVGALLVFFALGRLGTGIAELPRQGEATFGEAILYDHAARIVRGDPLYQPLDRPPYSVAAYTPLYYGLVAALQAVVGPAFWPGRLLSLLAGIAAATLIGRVTSRRAGSGWSGVFAGSLFLALGFAGRIPFFALYKEDTVGVALSLGAIAALGGGRTPSRLVLAGILAALAILTKQTFVASALAGTAWLIRENRRQAWLFSGVWLGTVLGVFAAMELANGAFLANAFFANAVPPRRDALLENLQTLLQYQMVPLILAAMYVVDRARSGERPLRDLLVLYWLASFLSLVGLARPGSAHNYWIELAGSTSILATLTVWDHLGRRSLEPSRAALPTLMLGANVCVLLYGLRSAVVPVKSFLLSRPKPEPEFAGLVERVRAEPREVLADPPDVVVLAGRRNLLELYFSAIRYIQGKWDPAPFVTRICRGDVGLVVLRYRLDSDARGVYQGYPYWPPPVLAALRERMELSKEQAGRFLYVPAARTGSSGAGPGGPCRDAATSR